MTAGRWDFRSWGAVTPIAPSLQLRRLMRRRAPGAIADRHCEPSAATAAETPERDRPLGTRVPDPRRSADDRDLAGGHRRPVDPVPCSPVPRQTLPQAHRLLVGLGGPDG